MVVALATVLHAQDRTSDLVAKAVRYVQEYERDFSAVVCEEHQTQRVVKSNGKVDERRDLVSDVLLVKVGDRTLLFRDVIAVDGRKMGDRQKRLQTLFLDTPRTALQQARAIAEESMRYNIGFTRSFSGLLLPLAILRPTRVDGFRFAGDDLGLTFQEIRSPSLVRHRKGFDLLDMFLRGSLTIDGETGQLRAASLTASNDELESTVDIRYEESAAVGLLVPVSMEERITRTANPKADRLEVTSTYSAFRKFQVTVRDEIAVPR